MWDLENILKKIMNFFFISGAIVFIIAILSLFLPADFRVGNFTWTEDNFMIADLIALALILIGIGIKALINFFQGR
jgi:hypothetical protein